MRKLLAMAAAVAAVLVMTGSASAQGKKGKFGFGKGGGGGNFALLTNADVQKDLKLSEEQIKRLDQLQIQQGGFQVLLTNAKVKEKLDLSEAQTEKIQALQKDSFTKFKELFEGFKEASKEDKEATFKKMADLQKGLLEDAIKVLNDDQKKAFEELRGPPSKEPPGPGSLEKNLQLSEEQTKRLGQLQIQQQGTNALLSAKVSEKIDLKDDQKEKIMEILKEAGPKFKELFQGFFQASKEDREATMKKMAELQKSLLEDALKVLNDDQKKAFEELRGEPFKGVLPPGGFGGMGMGMGMGGANFQIEAMRAPRRPAVAALI
jgi:Spy/CpxP family protein refolding chaperone